VPLPKKENEELEFGFLALGFPWIIDTAMQTRFGNPASGGFSSN